MTALTRELERTRNGEKIMERTLEAAALRIKELEDALRPFASDAEQWGLVSSEHRPMFWQLAGTPDEAKFTIGDLRRAAALLEGA